MSVRPLCCQCHILLQQSELRCLTKYDISTKSNPHCRTRESIKTVASREDVSVGERRMED